MVEAVRRVLIEVDDAVQAVSIGICGQSPTLVLVDTIGTPIRPAIIWQDTRAIIEAEELRGRQTAEEWEAIFGMALPVDASYPLARLRWLRIREPATLARCRAILQPKDFLIYRLTGQFVSDIWSSKGILHQVTGAPISALHDLIGLDLTVAPRGIRLGAVMLAGLGAGIFSDTAAATAAMVRPGTQFLPDPGVAGRYDHFYRIYRDMYPALRSFFPRLADERAV